MNKTLSLKNQNIIAPENDIIPHPFIIFGIISFLCVFIFNTAASPDFNPVPLTITALVIIALIAVYLAVTKNLSPENAVILIICSGFILRLCYVLYTSINVVDDTTFKERQHDFYTFEGGIGHAGYIDYFFNNGLKLPDINPTTRSQFYHPPLHHMISAVFMYILWILGFTYERCVASIQYLTLFYSTCCMILSCKIFKELKLHAQGLVVAVALIAFHPTFFLLAGSANNDILSITFIIATIYNTIVWYKNPTLKRILYIALTISLGMLTKLSVALVAIPVAFVFLIKLFEEKDKIKEYIKQYAIFGGLCVPLGLLYVVRNALIYNVPITYVPRLAEDSDQFIGNYTFFERMFDFSYNPFSSPFLARVHTGADYFEYNPIVSLLKTSLFGEYNYATQFPDRGGILFFSWLLTIANIILAVGSFVLVIVMLFKKSNVMSLANKVLLGGIYFLTLISFIKFAFDFPHNCSQDFRYAVATLIVGAFAIGLFTDGLDDKRKQALRSKKSAALSSAASVSIYVVTVLFCISSAAVYLMID